MLHFKTKIVKSMDFETVFAKVFYRIALQRQARKSITGNSYWIVHNGVQDMLWIRA
jgi:hypothetical protein